eukprot:1826379-Rhodomonas_salina.1
MPMPVCGVSSVFHPASSSGERQKLGFCSGQFSGWDAGPWPGPPLIEPLARWGSGVKSPSNCCHFASHYCSLPSNSEVEGAPLSTPPTCPHYLWPLSQLDWSRQSNTLEQPYPDTDPRV